MAFQAGWVFWVGRAFLGYYGLAQGAIVVAIASLFTLKNVRQIWAITHGKM